MLHSCCRPLSRCFGRRGDGLLWHTDLKPHASGDFSIAVVQANSSLEDQAQVLTYPSATYVGVYDGHGGPEASRFINSRLFPHIHSKIFFLPKFSAPPDLIFRFFLVSHLLNCHHLLLLRLFLCRDFFGTRWVVCRRYQEGV